MLLLIIVGDNKDGGCDEFGKRFLEIREKKKIKRKNAGQKERVCHRVCVCGFVTSGD